MVLLVALITIYSRKVVQVVGCLSLFNFSTLDPEEYAACSMTDITVLLHMFDVCLGLFIHSFHHLQQFGLKLIQILCQEH